MNVLDQINILEQVNRTVTSQELECNKSVTSKPVDIENRERLNQGDKMSKFKHNPQAKCFNCKDKLIEHDLEEDIYYCSGTVFEFESIPRVAHVKNHVWNRLGLDGQWQAVEDLKKEYGY